MEITLKAARTNKGLTQQEAADLIGVSRDMISNWETGRTYPTVKNIQSIERAYEISYNDIKFFCEDITVKPSDSQEEG